MQRLKLLPCAFILNLFSTICFSQTITTIAGNGTYGFNGDNISATTAQIASPKDIDIDGFGNIYIIDGGNNRIRKISTTGIISTIAGTGVAGFSGDDGLATAAQLNTPNGIALGANGDLLICDQGNNRLRKINFSGVVSTIAGTGIAGLSGNGGLATLAQLNVPYDVTRDSNGNIYIIDNNQIRKINSSGIISTIAGGGSLSASQAEGGAATLATMLPLRITCDASGNLYITDYNICRVRKVSPSGNISTVIGNGVCGFSGDSGNPLNSQISILGFGIVTTTSDIMYFVDNNNNRIRKVTSFSTLPVKISTFNAAFTQKSISIKWTTTNENGIAYYNLQRSSNGIDFKTISSINSLSNLTNNNSYDYLDEDVINQNIDKIYYRLAIVEKDGTTQYSEIISLKINQKKSFIIYPNPIKNYLRVKGNNLREIQILDMTGRELHKQCLNEFDTKVYINLKSGVYLIKVNSSKNETETKKIVIE